MVTILAIDDNKDNLISLKAIIQDAFPDSIFFSALNGRIGIELAIKHDPDVILLDIVMPEMDGFEVCRMLKNNQNVSNIPVVFLTANTGSKESRIKALDAGAEAFLSKPIDETELTAQIKAMVKIKLVNQQIRNEKEQLSILVAERTLELEESQAETLQLLEELKVENEKYKKAESELRESEEKYRLLHESAGVGIGYYTPDGTVISYNQVAAFNMNGEPEDFAGKSIYSLFPKESADFYMGRIIKALNSEISQEYEDKVELPKGVKWFQSVFTRIQDAGQKVIGVQIISTDITKLKEAELALKESEQRYRLVFDNNLDAFIITNPDQHIQSVNPAACEMFGRTKEEICQLGRNSIIDFSDPRIPAALEERTRTGKFFGELTGLRRDGTKFPIELSSTIFTDFKGNLRTSILIRDITERKQAEETLRETKEYLENLLDYANAPIIVWDSKFRITQFNKAFERLSGRTVSEVLGKSVEILFPANTRNQSVEYIKKASTGERWEVVEIEIQDLKGNVHTLLWNSAAIYSPDGNTVLATIAQGQDITERKHTEEKLIEEQLFNYAIIENLPGIFYLYTYPDLKIIRWNKNHETMLDLTAQELKLKLSEPWERTEVKDHIISTMHEVAKNGYGQTELSIYKKDGSEIPFILTGVRLDIKDQTFIMGFGIDITDRKKAEELRKENEARLSELVATKDKFFSIISHDLKSPFNSILGLSNLLVEQIQEKNYDGIEEYASIIQSSSQRAMELLKNLLDWSRSQTGRIEFSPEYVEMVNLVNEVTELLSEAAQQKSIGIVKELPRNILSFADKSMISTILRNLISNSIKFTLPGGQIVISAVRKKDELIINVADNGVGIKKEVLGKLFQIAENQTTLGTQNERGTGLGLILCKEFVEKHGGRIWVESEPGVGSKFSFAIPKI